MQCNALKDSLKILVFIRYSRYQQDVTIYIDTSIDKISAQIRHVRVCDVFWMQSGCPQDCP